MCYPWGLIPLGAWKRVRISRVHYVGTQGANAVGLLLSPQYWQMK